MLPAAFPDANIFRFGYASNWFGDDRLDTRPEIVAEKLLNKLCAARQREPERSLIFVAHSFGGLVLVKVGLRRSYCFSL